MQSKKSVADAAKTVTLPEKRSLWHRISNAPIETLYRIQIITSLEPAIRLSA